MVSTSRRVQVTEQSVRAGVTLITAQTDFRSREIGLPDTLEKIFMEFFLCIGLYVTQLRCESIWFTVPVH